MKTASILSADMADSLPHAPPQAGEQWPPATIQSQSSGLFPGPTCWHVKGHLPYQARTTLCDGELRESLPKAFQNCCFGRTPAGGLELGTQHQAIPEATYAAQQSGRFRRTCERTKVSRGGRGITQVGRRGSAETWGHPHWRAQPFQTGSFVENRFSRSR